MIFSKLKSYALYLGAGLVALLYFMLRIKSAHVDKLKLEAVKTQKLALEKQRKQAAKTIEKLTEAEKEGKANVQKAIDRAATGKRDHFN